jgi:hypothetical protein
MDPVFAKTSPKRSSFFMIIKERFGLVFAKTGAINSGTSARPEIFCLWKISTDDSLNAGVPHNLKGKRERHPLVGDRDVEIKVQANRFFPKNHHH